MIFFLAPQILSTATGFIFTNMHRPVYTPPTLPLQMGMVQETSDPSKSAVFNLLMDASIVLYSKVQASSISSSKTEIENDIRKLREDEITALVEDIAQAAHLPPALPRLPTPKTREQLQNRLEQLQILVDPTAISTQLKESPVPQASNLESAESMTGTASQDHDPPEFNIDFQDQLLQLFRWRRDVRHFRRDALPENLLNDLLEVAELAPSVGLSQPWRFVEVASDEARAAVLANYRRCNADALASYSGENARRYAGLKLAGLQEAPLQLAVFCDEGTLQGKGLGRRTMPEALRYSVVGAIQSMWLAARSRGIGLGWVSILEPTALTKELAVPEDWYLVAYLCIGYPEQDFQDPELQRRKWEKPTSLVDKVLRR